MAIYVDQLANWGWVMRGRVVRNCHMFTDELNLEELHLAAERIGMKRQWFQAHRIAPHYDLTASRRLVAVSIGVIEVSRREASAIWKARRDLEQAIEPMKDAANSAAMTFGEIGLSR